MAKKRKPAHAPRMFDRPGWPEMKSTIIGYVRNVYYIEDAVRAVGLTERWWYKWQAAVDNELKLAEERAVKRGKDNVVECVSKRMREPVHFVQAMRQAQSETRILCAGAVRKAEPLEYLARTDPERWGRKDRMPWIDPDSGGGVVPVVVYMPDNRRGPSK